MRGCQKSINRKYESNRNNNNDNNKIRCRVKTNLTFVIQNKTTSRKKRKQKNIMKQKANEPITKSKNQKLT